MLAVEHTVPESQPGGRGDFHPAVDFFTPPLPSFGPRAFDLAIGPVRIRVTGLPDAWAPGLEERYRPFVVEPSNLPSAFHESPDLTIAVKRAGVPRFLALRPDGEPETYRMLSRRDGPRLTLWSYEFAGFIDAAARRAELALVEDAALAERGIENFLRVATAAFVLEHGGFLLHGSGVVRRGTAYVFFGPSGSGKTTVTTLSPQDIVLSDDLTLVFPDGAGYAAAGIPFGMAHHTVPATNASFPIASFNRLIQSPEVRRDRLPPAEALAHLAASLPFVMQESGQAARALEAAGRALRVVPTCLLHFRKDDAFWNVVEEA